MTNSSTQEQTSQLAVGKLDITADTALFHAQQRRDLALKATEIDLVAAACEADIKKREAAILATISAEIDETTDKPRFSSEDKRKAELAVRAETDKELATLKATADQCRTKARQYRISEEFHHDVTRIIIAFGGKDTQ